MASQPVAAWLRRDLSYDQEIAELEAQVLAMETSVPLVPPPKAEAPKLRQPPLPVPPRRGKMITSRLAL